MLAGVVLGLAGAALDFYSGYQVVVQSSVPSAMGMAESYSSSGLAWGIGLAALGVVLVVTSLAALSPGARQRMGAFGKLMVVYGVAMLVVAASMYTGMAPMMQGASASALAMLMVGLLMLGNGLQMAGSHM